MIKTLSVGVTGIVLAGCTSAFQLKDDTPAPTGEESVVILGVKDEHYRVSIFPGHIADNGNFVMTLVRPATVAGIARNGYLVGKAKAGDVVAITLVRYQDDPKALLRYMDFVPCNGTRTMVFTVPHGKVVYLGSVDYQFAGKSMKVSYSQDLDSAQRYIDSTFPALQGKVEYIAPEFRPMNRSCNSTMVIPVYIGR